MHIATTLPDVRIATPRLVLRRLAESDLDDLVREVDDFEVVRMVARIPHPYTRADALAFFNGAGRDGNDLPLMITAGGKVVGGIGLTRVHSDREFGYWLGRAHWGRGYATEAGHAFLAHAFAAFGADPIRSGVFADNPASLRVQDKLGFVRVGRHPVDCLARGQKVEHIDTLLTRARFLEARR